MKIWYFYIWIIINFKINEIYKLLEKYSLWNRYKKYIIYIVLDLLKYINLL